jgi:hypothetical protein
MTYFKRPNLLRFEWCDYSTIARLPDRVNIIWSDGKDFYTKYCFDDKPNQVRDLSLLVEGAAGVSSGTAPAIAILLTDQIGGYKLTNLKLQVMCAVRLSKVGGVIICTIHFMVPKFGF